MATVPSGRGAKHAFEAGLRALPPGTVVAVIDARPGSRRRARRLANQLEAGVRRSYILLPSARAACYVVEDRPEPVRYLWQRLFATPPGTGLFTSLVIAGAVHASHALPWWSLGSVAPGRLTLLVRV